MPPKLQTGLPKLPQFGEPLNFSDPLATAPQPVKSPVSPPSGNMSDGKPAADPRSSNKHNSPV